MNCKKFFLIIGFCFLTPVFLDASFVLDTVLHKRVVTVVTLGAGVLFAYGAKEAHDRIDLVHASPGEYEILYNERFNRDNPMNLADERKNIETDPNTDWREEPVNPNGRRERNIQLVLSLTSFGIAFWNFKFRK